ncbi:MAG: DUF4292 domain-containing protein [Balneolaceae bacterium]|nr:DUF4292 domain-containing protein [Balneolaceae bacterium]
MRQSPAVHNPTDNHIALHRISLHKESIFRAFHPGFGLASIAAVFMLTFLLTGCGTTGPAAGDISDMERSDISASELADLVPNYSENLITLSGTGRAIVSEPGGSERVTLQFSSGREASLITIRTSVGIEGGQILVDSDSLLIYNKVDNYAEKVSLKQSNLTTIGSLASLNMLDLFNFPLNPDNIREIYENNSSFVAVLDDDAFVTIRKDDGMVKQVVQNRSDAAYSRIEYEGYARLDDFYLPRKITIFSSDGSSRATFLVQRLEVNPDLPPLEIKLPDDIPIYRI